MGRIVTKELAEKMVRKLGALKIAGKNKAHDQYAVEHRGIVIGIISIRRGSERDKGHDHIQRELHISPNQARQLGQCPWSRDDFIRCLQDKGLVAPDEEEEPEGEKEAEDENEGEVEGNP